MASYPLQFNIEELDRLTTQSLSLSDDILPLLGKQSEFCLEIGCGAGSNVPVLCKYNNNINYLGIDISSEAIEHANSKYSSENIVFKIHEGSKIPKNDNSFDLVVIRLVLWGASNREEILKEAYRVLKPNGIIYCFEPDDQFLINYPPKMNFERLIKEWQSKVISAGCDPFIGRKLNSYLSTVGFKVLSNQVKLSTYNSINSSEFLNALKNLGRIFLSNGPSFFNLQNSSQEWINATYEIETCSNGSILTEGYFIIIGTKDGVSL